MFPSCKIYQGNCIYEDDYISKMERNKVAHLSESNAMHDRESAHHLKNHQYHSFNWVIVSY